MSDTEQQQGDEAHLGADTAHLVTSTKTRAQQEQGVKLMLVIRGPTPHLVPLTSSWQKNKKQYRWASPLPF